MAQAQALKGKKGKVHSLESLPCPGHPRHLGGGLRPLASGDHLKEWRSLSTWDCHL